MESQKYNLIKEDLKKIGIGAVVAVVGALLTYVQDLIPNINFGDFIPVIVAINSIVVNIVRKWLSTITY